MIIDKQKIENNHHKYGWCIDDGSNPPWILFIVTIIMISSFVILLHPICCAIKVLEPRFRYTILESRLRLLPPTLVVLLVLEPWSSLFIGWDIAVEDGSLFVFSSSREITIAADWTNSRHRRSLFGSIWVRQGITPLNKRSEFRALRMSSGVIPSIVLSFGSAWWSSRTTTMSGNSISDAMWRGVCQLDQPGGSRWLHRARVTLSQPPSYNFQPRSVTWSIHRDSPSPWP